MKFKGRMIGVFLAFVAIGSILYFRYYPAKPYDAFLLTALPLFFLLCGWMLGQKYDRVKFYSEKDALTSIYNRRFVLQVFSKLTALVDRKNETLCLTIIDVDNFKTINDSYGHDTGDQVLQHLSNVIVKNVRKGDVVARWGGDEFVIITPFTDRQGADSLIQRIEQELQEVSAQMQIDISTSIGTAVYPSEGLELECLLRVADQSMYERKAVAKC